MLSVADTAHSVYPELVVGLPGFVEATARARKFAPFASMMPEIRIAPAQPDSPFELTPANPTTAAAIRGEGEATPAPWDAELVPDPDDLRPFLFPSVHALVVDDAGIRFLSREAIPTINLSTAVPIALAALVPAVRSAEQARARARAGSNLSQIGLAFHKFHDVNKRFPTDIRSKDGKPLLSWKVAILPFLEQNELFKEFKLDEPWDSAHNKALIPRMPTVFAVPDEPLGEPGQTSYRGFSGTGAIFDPIVPEGIAITDIMDGTSNTIAVVEAREAVPWTKPGSDLGFENDPTHPEKLKAALEQLGGHSRGGFSAVFCDGAPRFVKSSISLITLQALITRAGGEVISSDAF
jgi:hypothetical protein